MNTGCNKKSLNTWSDAAICVTKVLKYAKKYFGSLNSMYISVVVQ